MSDRNEQRVRLEIKRLIGQALSDYSTTIEVLCWLLTAHFSKEDMLQLEDQSISPFVRLCLQLSIEEKSLLKKVLDQYSTISS